MHAARFCFIFFLIHPCGITFCRLVSGMENAVVVDRFYDKSNWCIILEKTLWRISYVVTPAIWGNFDTIWFNFWWARSKMFQVGSLLLRLFWRRKQEDSLLRIYMLICYWIYHVLRTFVYHSFARLLGIKFIENFVYIHYWRGGAST